MSDTLRCTRAALTLPERQVHLLLRKPFRAPLPAKLHACTWWFLDRSNQGVRERISTGEEQANTTALAHRSTSRRPHQSPRSPPAFDCISRWMIAGRQAAGKSESAAHACPRGTMETSTTTSIFLAHADGRGAVQAYTRRLGACCRCSSP